LAFVPSRFKETSIDLPTRSFAWDAPNGIDEGGSCNLWRGSGIFGAPVATPRYRAGMEAAYSGDEADVKHREVLDNRLVGRAGSLRPRDLTQSLACARHIRRKAADEGGLSS